jgi:hypothetical protein
MTVNRPELVGLSVLVLTLTTTVSLTQKHQQSATKRKYRYSCVERKYGSPRSRSPAAVVCRRS